MSINTDEKLNERIKSLVYQMGSNERMSFFARNLAGIAEKQGIPIETLFKFVTDAAKLQNISNERIKNAERRIAGYKKKY